MAVSILVLIVRLKRSAPAAFWSLSDENRWMPCCSKNLFNSLLVNSKPLSVWSLTGFLGDDLLNNFLNASNMSWALLFFTGTAQAYLENVSIATRIHL